MFNYMGGLLMDNTRILVLWISVGLKVLSARIVLLVGLAMVFGLFCWAMWNANYFTIACAALFAILVFLPIIKLDAGQSKDRAIVSPKENSDE